MASSSFVAVVGNDDVSGAVVVVVVVVVGDGVIRLTLVTASSTSSSRHRSNNKLGQATVMERTNVSNIPSGIACRDTNAVAMYESPPMDSNTTICNCVENENDDTTTVET